MRHRAVASRELDLSDMHRVGAVTIARAVWHSCKPDASFPWEHFRPNTDD
ncbi:MAG: hypothetical protein RMJ43_12980 [Chloroherpetonaceae bacterium]|nr:hypothetical protein [Chthonomonadaceae bacterium]MDW8208741.1 hypothetical protein [Chloroherpetonaceae bacterium]